MKKGKGEITKIAKTELLNTYINNLSMDEAIERIEFLLKKETQSYVVAVNVDVVIKMEKDKKLQRIIHDADLALVDGMPLIWISKIYKRPIKQKVSGSDLVPRLCSVAAEQGYQIFILGGRPGVAEKARAVLETSYPSIKIVGTYAPPMGFEKDPNEIEKVNKRVSEKKPDLLIVCFGCPKQEKFIYDNFRKYEARVSICAGATVDFLAGEVNRAPRWMSDHGLEWFYRFLQEPRRLFKRYFIDDMKIIFLTWKYRR